MGHLIRASALTAVVLAVGCFHSAALEPDQAGVDFPVQGEYAGGEPPIGVQVVATGGGTFRAVTYAGGLPGAGGDPVSRQVFPGRWDGNEVVFDGGPGLRIREGQLQAGAHRLPKLERASPTLGAAPPDGAVVLFDGQGAGGFDGEVDERGLLAAGATSRERFGSFDLHLEFRTPFMPTASGQARGNSGVYLQGRYEVQILDSFGEVGEWNECGGIYEVQKPAVNMAFPPLTWQTYDMRFQAARFGEDGEKLAPARVTVRHNGVVIQDDVELPGPTGLGDAESAEPGPLYLQDHWNPVFFRNVWLLPHSLP